MKGKRDTTEDKIRILREADTGKNLLEVCREHNLSQTSFHRWKRQLGASRTSARRVVSNDLRTVCREDTLSRTTRRFGTRRRYRG